MISLEIILFTAAVLILISVTITKFSEKAGIPALLLFIAVGMFAGSEGVGGILFDDMALARNIGIIALIFILFAGGLDTNWSDVKPIVKSGTTLSTIGVFLTALFIGIFVSYMFNVSFLWGFLVGGIISSTDAAAVFSVIRSRSISLKGLLKPLLEFESASNDPMAVFLTIGTIQLLTNPEMGLFDTILFFLFQMGIGLAIGLIFGKLMVFLINKMSFNQEGSYTVFVLAMTIIIFSLTSLIGGSGFLAIYISGMIIGNSSFVHKKSTVRLFDGLAVLSQIAMFITLGLLVFPSKIFQVIVPGLLLSAFLFFVARPASVFLSLLPFRKDGNKFRFKEKLFISWVGLRGAVPIILATFPSMAGVPQSDLIFNLVFFVVITSVLLQGWSLTPVAKLLKLDIPLKKQIRHPIEFESGKSDENDLYDFYITENSNALNKTIIELGMPKESLIVLINRSEQYLVPTGGTLIQLGDIVLVLTNKKMIEIVRKIFE